MLTEHELSEFKFGDKRTIELEEVSKDFYKITLKDSFQPDQSYYFDLGLIEGLYIHYKEILELLKSFKYENFKNYQTLRLWVTKI